MSDLTSGPFKNKIVTTHIQRMISTALEHAKQADEATTLLDAYMHLSRAANLAEHAASELRDEKVCLRFPQLPRG